MMGAKEKIMKFGSDHYLQEIQKLKYLWKKAATLKHTNSGSWMRNSECGHRRKQSLFGHEKDAKQIPAWYTQQYQRD